MIKVFEAFSGYGSQSIALKNIGVDFEVVAISEIDKYAIKAYEAIHGKVNNLGDISKIEISDIPNHDLFTYSFPCQDISVGGRKKGFDENSGTRSSLLWECKSIIESKKPKYLFLENVKNLISKKHKPNFDKWCSWLEKQGYKNYWKILNAIDFNIPQNRERVFMISVLGEQQFNFPNKIDLNKSILDILENEVDHKFLLPQFIQDRFISFPEDKLNSKLIEVVGTTAPNPYDSNGNLIYDKCTSAWVYNPKKCVGALASRDYKQPKQIILYKNNSRIIRKLSVKEYFRLMGLNEQDINKLLNSGISNTQLYKLAGNSIVVNVLEEIFKNIFK